MALATFLEINMVYVLESQSDGLYIARNREYMPLGCPRRDAEYMAGESSQRDAAMGREPGARWRIGPALAQKLSWTPLVNMDNIWLYNDGCVPTSSSERWASYQAKLKLLAGLKAHNP